MKKKIKKVKEPKKQIVEIHIYVHQDYTNFGGNGTLPPKTNKVKEEVECQTSDGTYHNVLSPKVASSWEEELIKQIEKNPDFVFYDYDGGLGKDLKEFISSTIKEERERLIGEIIQIADSYWIGGENAGWIIPKDDFINKIKSLS